MVLLDLLSRPNIASKEWLIRQYDHEVRGLSVIKPLHTVGSGTAQPWSGPNDGGVIQLKEDSEIGLAVGCGMNPRLIDLDPALMAQAAVDEAIRNVLCVGAEFGEENSVLALVPQVCWPDPSHDSAHLGALARTSLGMHEACLELSVPLISEKKGGNRIISPSAPPSLLMTAVARVSQMKRARSSDFKLPGDVIYLLGPGSFGLIGSELSVLFSKSLEDVPVDFHLTQFGKPSWEIARRLYSWIGGAKGERQSSLKSLHDVSEGGFLISVAEGLIARGLGATLRIPTESSPWEFLFGEGFHSFVASASDSESLALEAEWTEFGIPFQKIGLVESQDRLEVIQDHQTVLNVGMKAIRSAWLKEGFWE
jgi:phosphoribosylformylglycinamidine synthase